MDRGDIDDHPATTPHHVRDGILGPEERTGEADIEDEIPVLDGEVGQRRNGVSFGVIDPDVQPAIVAEGRICQGTDVGGSADIRVLVACGQAGGTDGGHHGRSRLVLQVTQQHGGPGRRQGLSDGAADALCGSRDNGDSPI